MRGNASNQEIIVARLEQLVETLHDITEWPRAEIWDTAYQVAAQKRETHFLEDLPKPQPRR